MRNVGEMWLNDEFVNEIFMHVKAESVTFDFHLVNNKK